jgi:hypothetical protein
VWCSLVKFYYLYGLAATSRKVLIDFFGMLVFWAYMVSCRQWLSIYSANSQHLSDHLIQIDNLSDFSKKVRSSIVLIWLSCVWIVWKERNCRIFKDTKLSFVQLLDKVKLLSFCG